jgi:hypothetical protein
MPILLRSAYVLIEHRVASRLLYVTRSSQEFPDAEAAREEVAQWRKVLSAQSTEVGLLLDWRSAPLTTDGRILREVVRGTDEIGRCFTRQAVLLKSVLGDLQARRLRRLHEAGPELFTDEQKAYEYVTAR